MYRAVVEELRTDASELQGVMTPFKRRLSGPQRPYTHEEIAFLRRIFDPSLLVGGYEAYVPRARQLRGYYDTELLRIMNKYGVYDEGQLVSGHILAFASSAHKRARYHELKERIRHNLQVHGRFANCLSHRLVPHLACPASVRMQVNCEQLRVRSALSHAAPASHSLRGLARRLDRSSQSTCLRKDSAS